MGLSGYVGGIIVILYSLATSENAKIIIEKEGGDGIVDEMMR